MNSKALISEPDLLAWTGYTRRADLERLLRSQVLMRSDMSLDYIRRHYNVPAKKGGRIRFTDSNGYIWEGRITSARGTYLRVLPDDRIPSCKTRLTLHPTWNVEYI